MQLGYLMPQVQLHPSNLIMMQFLQALVTAAARHHYRVVVVPQQSELLNEVRRLIASRTVDGFLLSGLPPSNPEVELLAELTAPFACFGRISPGLPQPWADIDNAEAVEAAVGHVLGQGYTRPGYIGYVSDSYWDIERENGFRAGLARHGIPGHGAGLLRLDGDTGARASIRSFISSARPDAVLTGSDNIAAVVYGVATELNLRVGHDLAVTGFDGSIGSGLVYPQLTSVLIPVDEIARRIVSRVLRQLDQGPDGGPGEIVPAALRPRGSTSPRRDPEPGAA
jgi:DNA-binding LacI/PurR family transcriptional regulator